MSDLARGGSSDGFDPGRLPAAYLSTGSSSFAEFVGQTAPHLLPGHRLAGLGGLGAGGAGVAAGHSGQGGIAPSQIAPHGTTIVTLAYDGGVLLAGDRRATMGNIVASRDIEKVFVTDDHSAVGIAGTAGLAIEVVKLFQVELEHFEKLEGVVLSLEGKANRLATMIRGNLALALQGLSVVPVFAGFDLDCGRGRMFSYDVTGGCYEEHDHHSVGSGSLFARGSLKKLWRPQLGLDDAVRVAIEALFDAADDDTATGGPDLGRRIWPTCAVIDATGARLLLDETLAQLVEVVVADRRGNPGGNPRSNPGDHPGAHPGGAR